MSERPPRDPIGFVPMKREGEPIHPDELDCDMTDEQYDRQLLAYRAWAEPAGELMPFKCTGDYFTDGLTIARLKRILATWPETHADGDPCLVFMTHQPEGDKPWQRLSNQAYQVGAIDSRAGDTADLFLGPIDLELYAQENRK